jgi:DNA-binding SARP family transcriptional activator
MAGIRATLLGRFMVERNDVLIKGVEANKVRELLGYLIVNRERPQPREMLAELLWKDQPPDRSRKCLRQTLWKLNCALKDDSGQGPPSLLVDDEWIQFNQQANWWLDIAEFEHTFASLKNKRASELDVNEFQTLQGAAALYHGDLLEGWYQDWCLVERERLQAIYLMTLSKLVQYCALRREYDAGLAYGEVLLRHDRAYERAHRQMMTLYFMRGDRTQALRQYQRCVAALREELDIVPSARTVQLYQQIKAGSAFQQESFDPGLDLKPTSLMLHNTAQHMEQLAESLAILQSQIKQDINLIEAKF